MEKKIIKGSVAIVPTYAISLSILSSEEEKDWFRENREKLSRLAGIKSEGSEREYLVRIKININDCDGWQYRFAGFQEIIGIHEEDFIKSCKSSRERRILGKFPSYFPSRIFEGVKEGDIIKLDCPEYNVVIELTCKQLDYKYRMFDKFEEELQSVLDRGACSF